MGLESIVLKNATVKTMHYHAVISCRGDILFDSMTEDAELAFESFMCVIDEFRPDYFDQEEIDMVEDLYYEALDNGEEKPIKLSFGQVDAFLFPCQECVPYNNN